MNQKTYEKRFLCFPTTVLYSLVIAFWQFQREKTRFLRINNYFSPYLLSIAAKNMCSSLVVFIVGLGFHGLCAVITPGRK